MKCICITGAIQSDLDVVSDILRQAGMKPPKAANRGESIDITSWHEQAMIIDTEEADSGYTIINPGRFMEQLAGDIFVANNKSSFWGWADVRSTWLLDFWLNFDPRLCFVFVYASPQQMLANAMEANAEIDSVGAVMDAWQAHYQQILRFHLRNPQRSLLVDASECAENPYLLIERCAEQWKLKIDAPVIADTARAAHNFLSLYLAQQLCKSYPQVAGLQHELAATLTHLAEIEQAVNPTPLSPEHIVADYRVLRSRSVEQELLQAAREELEIHVLKHESQQKQIDALQGEIAALAIERQAKIDQLAKKHNDIISSYIQQQKDAEQEKQLVALQLHQVQEELEAYFLKQESQQKQVDALQGEVAALISVRDEQNARVIESQAIIADQEQQKKEGEIRLKDAEQENELLLLQLHQVQEELEAYFLKQESQQKQVDALQGEVAALISVRDEQGARVIESQAIIADQEQKKKEGEIRLKDAEQENELLLLQLHQVQEELEHYFLQHQDKQKELQNAEIRWQRMLRRNPDYFDFDYDSIEVLSGENEEDGSAIIWRLKNLNVADRLLSEIEFKTIMEQDVAGFVFSRQPDNANIFTRWLVSPENQDEFILAPSGKDGALQQFSDILTDFATKDWDLFNVLIRLLDDALQQPEKLMPPVGFNPDFLRSGLGKLRESIERIPSTLRYDQVALKSEQVSPDYEHLWLRFNNLSFGNKCWPEFEFRLACAPISPNGFGNYPRLQFPEKTGQAPFENWFIESYDDFGAKLEWRFALPEAMDMNVWQRISENDRDFLSALVARLPTILTSLQNAGIELERPWEDWINMAKEIQHILAIRVPPLLALAASQTLTDLEEDISDVAASANPDVALNVEDSRQRMLRRNPDCFDYDSIEVLSGENEDGSAIIWRLKNLNIADRLLSEIEFKTIMEQDVAGFVFFLQPDNDNIFTRWLVGPENQDEFILAPVGKDGALQQFSDILTDFATKDWDLFNVLIRLLDDALQQPEKLMPPVGFNPDFLRSGLGKLRENIERIPSTLRYDQVALKSEQVSPDYEHLWLRFNNLSFGNKCWPEFEFRLACAPISPNGFGSYPRLQFPEKTGQAPFENWFIESYDDFGAKLEWRFALPEAMDMNVWQRISENDRDFLSALVVRLPTILTSLQNAGIELERPWEDWINMAKEIQRILAIRVASLLALAASQTLTGLDEDISATIAVLASVDLAQL